MKTERREFTKALRATITTALVSAGFQWWKPGGPDSVGIYYFRRRRGECIDLIEIIIEKYGSDSVYVELGSFSGDSVQTQYDGPLAAELATTAALPNADRARLKGNKWFGLFGASALQSFRSGAARGKLTAERITSRLDAAEKWFRDKKSRRGYV
jgi:hypothetical protein